MSSYGIIFEIICGFHIITGVGDTADAQLVLCNLPTDIIICRFYSIGFCEFL